MEHLAQVGVPNVGIHIMKELLFPGVTFATIVIDALQPQQSSHFGLSYSFFLLGAQTKRRLCL